MLKGTQGTPESDAPPPRTGQTRAERVDTLSCLLAKGTSNLWDYRAPPQNPPNLENLGPKTQGGKRTRAGKQERNEKNTGPTNDPAKTRRARPKQDQTRPKTAPNRRNRPNRPNRGPTGTGPGRTPTPPGENPKNPPRFYGFPPSINLFYYGLRNPHVCTSRWELVTHRLCKALKGLASTRLQVGAAQPAWRQSGHPASSSRSHSAREGG